MATDQTAFWGLATLGTFTLGHLVDLIGLQARIIGNASAILGFVAVLFLRGHLRAMKGSAQ